MTARGRSFYKMTGSGNDFVFFDVRRDPAEGLETAESIARVCARGTGVGADGVVFLDGGHGSGDVAIRYYNADGSQADLCGNATLCTVSLVAELGAADTNSFTIGTDSGVLAARMHEGKPEFDLPEVLDADPSLKSVSALEGESAIGWATVGVPHVIVLVPDCELSDVVSRGRHVREHESLRPSGANVNFVSRSAGGWRMRTYERGVEAETLACGTGSVAAAIMLSAWGETGDDVTVLTSSGEPLRIRLSRAGGIWRASLSGEGRLVYRGELASI